ncbi:hypothetical protein HALLA_08690 [Halostagnicola larsenii XH-48]|uniref:Uncharacterized protein n=1 Tax=Halostagnicola larsenii XH-48 TaxID=797299 RepID=W0JQ26_9EURY|nr:hypothetical protein HALLA_08690 [Halostagnicola larsenii XH-48]
MVLNDVSRLAVGLQTTLIGIVLIQIVTLENGFFSLFLVGIACVLIGTGLTFGSILQS